MFYVKYKGSYGAPVKIPEGKVRAVLVSLRVQNINKILDSLADGSRLEYDTGNAVYTYKKDRLKQGYKGP